MNSKEFQALLERRLKLTSQTLASKSSEYSTDDDKLHNFKRTATVAECHPAEALDGMLLKHYIWYRDALKKIKNGERFSQKIIDEKFGDIINYFILQEAIFTESSKLEYEKELTSLVSEDKKKRFLEGEWKARDMSGAVKDIVDILLSKRNVVINSDIKGRKVFLSSDSSVTDITIKNYLDSVNNFVAYPFSISEEINRGRTISVKYMVGDSELEAKDLNESEFKRISEKFKIISIEII